MVTSETRISRATGNKTGAKLSSSKERDASARQIQQCLDKYTTFEPLPGDVFCNAMFDGYLCWPPTPAGESISQNCPPARLSDTSSFAYRTCGDNGLWLGRRANESSAIGWTNYMPCFPADVQTLLMKVYDDNERDAQLKFEIAQRTRYMEIAGFSISLVALIISLIIFSYYRSLRNNRTRIHKSLFSAMVVQVVIRLILYIDQALIRSKLGDYYTYDNVTLRGIDNMPYLCESSYGLLEYAITVMFMWMFIEGLYLHNVVTANALRERISYLVYYATGWGLPLLVTAVWATMTALHYQRENVKKCWYGYNFSPLYWIVQGPRLAVIMINLVFLLNIMRVLIVKLRQSESTELEKVRKAVRAALVLLPLLGITNALNMIEAPLDGSVWKFGLWSYSTHFLRSFQGFFIALIYCFLNGEVRQVLKRHYANYMAMRVNNRRQRESLNYVSTATNRDREIIDYANQPNRSTWVPMTNLKRSRGSTSTNNAISDTEMRPGCSQGVYANQPNRSTWVPMTNLKRSRGSTSTNNAISDTEMGPGCSQGLYANQPNRSTWVPMTNLKRSRGSTSTNNAISDTEMGPGCSQGNKKNNRSTIKYYADCGTCQSNWNKMPRTLAKFTIENSKQN